MCVESLGEPAEVLLYDSTTQKTLINVPLFCSSNGSLSDEENNFCRLRRC